MSNLGTLLLRHRNRVTLCWKYKTKLFQSQIRSVHFREAPKKVAEKFRVRDKIPEGFQLIYRTPLLNYVHCCQIGSIIGGGFLVGLVLSQVSIPDFTDSSFEEGDKIQIRDNLDLIVGLVFLSVAAVSVYVVTQKCILRVYSNGEQYISVMNGFLGPLWKVKVTSLPGECVKSPPSKFSAWNPARHTINSKKVLLLEDHFRNNSDYNQMTGSK